MSWKITKNEYEIISYTEPKKYLNNDQVLIRFSESLDEKGNNIKEIIGLIKNNYEPLETK